MLLAGSELIRTEDGGVCPGVWTAKQQLSGRIPWNISYSGESIIRRIFEGSFRGGTSLLMLGSGG